MRISFLISCILGDLIGYNRNWNNIDAHFNRRLSATRPKDEKNALAQISTFLNSDEKYEKLKLFESFRRESARNSKSARKNFISEKRNLRIRNYLRRMHVSRKSGF